MREDRFFSGRSPASDASGHGLFFLMGEDAVDGVDDDER